MKKWFSFWACIGYSYVLIVVLSVAFLESSEEAFVLGTYWGMLVIGVVVIKYTAWAVLKKIFRSLKKKRG